MRWRVLAVDSGWRPTLCALEGLASAATPNLLAIPAAFITLPCMLGWHLIFSTYGFWLPNDPRGSGSSEVRARHIYEACGEATKVHTTRSVAHRPHDVKLRQLTKQ